MGRERGEGKNVGWREKWRLGTFGSHPKPILEIGTILELCFLLKSFSVFWGGITVACGSVSGGAVPNWRKRTEVFNWTLGLWLFFFFFVIFAKKKELGEMEHEGNERRMGDLVPLFKWISWIFVFSFYSFWCLLRKENEGGCDRIEMRKRNRYYNFSFRPNGFLEFPRSNLSFVSQ